MKLKHRTQEHIDKFKCEAFEQVGCHYKWNGTLPQMVGKLWIIILSIGNF